MKLLLIVILSIVMVACSSAPSVNESNDDYSIEDVDDLGEEEASERSEDEYVEMDEDEYSAMQEGLVLEENMEESDLTPDEIISMLRSEVKELKEVVAELKNTDISSVSRHKDSVKMQGNKMQGNKMQGNKMQGNKTNGRPINLVMKFSTKNDQKHWWGILEAAGIKDKFLSSSRGHYKIFLGYFKNHKNALATKNKIIKATGARTIEMIPSS
jgi:hypothetical protein